MTPRAIVSILLAGTVAAIMILGVIALAVDQVLTDDDATIVIADLFELSKMIVTGLFAWMGGYAVGLEKSNGM